MRHISVYFKSYTNKIYNKLLTIILLNKLSAVNLI